MLRGSESAPVSWVDVLGDTPEARFRDLVDAVGDSFERKMDALAVKGSAIEIAMAEFKKFSGGHPTTHQREVLESKKRFIAITAGVQGGKTSIGVSKYWTRIIEENKPGALYWLVAPDSIVGRTQRERFEAMAPEGWISSRKGADHNRVWHLRNGSRVEFRSGEKGERLVAATVDGVWVDEFTILKPGVWASSIRTRLAATGGWAIFTGTPAGRNWSYDEIWRPCLDSDDLRDDDFHGVTWKTSENPAVSAQEIESAKRTMSPAYFRRNYEASWEAFHGQVFEAFDPDRHVIDGLMVPDDFVKARFGGKDFGFAVPGCLLVVYESIGGEFYVLDEVHEAHQYPEWWIEKIKEKAIQYKLERLWCDPAEPARIGSIRNAVGISAQSSYNAQHQGILHLASLFYQNRILIHSRCKNLIRELSGYRWSQKRNHAVKEVPVKENDHGVDALRYAIMGQGVMAGIRAVPVSRSGAGGL